MAESKCNGNLLQFALACCKQGRGAGEAMRRIRNKNGTYRTEAPAAKPWHYVALIVLMAAGGAGVAAFLAVRYGTNYRYRVRSITPEGVAIAACLGALLGGGYGVKLLLEALRDLRRTRPDDERRSQEESGGRED